MYCGLMVRDGLLHKATFELRPGGRKGAGEARVWESEVQQPRGISELGIVRE